MSLQSLKISLRRCKGDKMAGVKREAFYARGIKEIGFPLPPKGLLRKVNALSGGDNDLIVLDPWTEIIVDSFNDLNKGVSLIARAEEGF